MKPQALSVDKFVEQSIFNYPSLYVNRTQVLMHAFIGYGTGLYWYKGGLVDMFYEGDRSENEVIHVMDESLKRKSGHPIMDAHVDEEIARWDKRNATYLARRNNAATLAVTPGLLCLPLRQPFLEASPYYNVPDDVKPDWLAAREELAAIIEPLYYMGASIRIPEELMRTEIPELSPEAAAVLRKIWEEVLND